MSSANNDAHEVRRRVRITALANRPMGQLQADGSCLLRIPYADHRELIMDILKHGAHCEVLGPPGLRQAAEEEVGKMGEKYI